MTFHLSALNKYSDIQKFDQFTLQNCRDPYIVAIKELIIKWNYEQQDSYPNRKGGNFEHTQSQEFDVLQRQQFYSTHSDDFCRKIAQFCMPVNYFLQSVEKSFLYEQLNDLILQQEVHFRIEFKRIENFLGFQCYQALQKFTLLFTNYNKEVQPYLQCQFYRQRWIELLLQLFYIFTWGHLQIIPSLLILLLQILIQIVRTD